MWSLWWNLAQYDCCPYKKMRLDHRPTQKEEYVKMKKIAICEQRSKTSEETIPADTLILDFQTPEF